MIYKLVRLIIIEKELGLQQRLNLYAKLFCLSTYGDEYPEVSYIHQKKIITEM